MTTPYSVSTSIGSMTYNNFVNAAITGPLSTNQYPTAIPYHSYGVLKGAHPTPPQFYPSQEPINSVMGVNAKHQYLRTSQSQTDSFNQSMISKMSRPLSMYNYSSNTRDAVSSHMNYIAPIQSSMYVNIKKSTAVGKSTYKVGLPDIAPITTKNYYPSGARSSLRRARSGGCVAPKKKGAY